MLVHTVLFHLKPNLASADRDAFQAGLESLREIPTLKAYYVGRPAPVTPRPVIDASYDYALTAVFEDVAAHDVYQQHPVHLRFIETCKVHWERVRVIDSMG